MPTTPARLRSTMNAMSQALEPVCAPQGQTTLIAACRVDLSDRTPVRLRSTVNVMNLALGPVRVTLERIDQIAVDQRRRSRLRAQH